jgi:hypothetical protein
MSYEMHVLDQRLRVYASPSNILHSTDFIQSIHQPQRPDVTAAWRSLLLPPTGPHHHHHHYSSSSSNKKLLQQRRPRAGKGVSPSPLYILVSKQGACGMLLRSLDESLRHLVELIDRLPSPSPSLLPASLLSHSYLWHLSPPAPPLALAPAPHLAGAIHLANLHAVRLLQVASASSVGNSTHVAGGESSRGEREGRGGGGSMMAVSQAEDGLPLTTTTTTTTPLPQTR